MTMTEKGHAPTPLKYVQPNQSALQRAFKDHPNLAAFINWQPEYSEKKGKWLKRPIQRTNDTKSHTTLDKALASGKPVGVVCNDTHAIIALDIDGVSPDHPQLARFFEEHPTYIEASPSGKDSRLRALYCLMDRGDKKLFKSKSTCKPEGQNCDVELYSSSGNFVTLTGKTVENKPIAVLTAADIIQHFPSYKAQATITKLPNQPLGVAPTIRAVLTPIGTWLREVPCDEHHPKVQNYINKKGYVYYDYWMLGLMALHTTFGPQEGYVHAVEWSKGSAAYDVDELEYKWSTLGKNPDYNQISYKTYQHLFNECTIQWPVKQGKSAIPVPTEISNFQAWLAHFGISIQVDAITQTIFLDGPASNLVHYYPGGITEAYATRGSDISRLANKMLGPCREYNFRPSHKQLQEFIRTIASGYAPKDNINRFAREIATKHTWKPGDGDYLAMIGRDILQRNPNSEYPSPEFHMLLVRKWLLSLGRHFWPDELPVPAWANASAEGMLILSGAKGGIGKSSFGVRLFPDEWKHLYTSAKPMLSGGYSDKDYKMQTCARIIVDYDEAERVYKANDEADLKAEQTATYDTFRPPYGADMLTFPRRYSHLASTNQPSLSIPREGARRCWWINVVYVDTYTMDDMDMYKLWAQIRYELAHAPKGQVPWLLTEEERKYLEGYLTGHRSENRWEMQLQEIYDFSPEGYEALLSLDVDAFEVTPSRPPLWHMTKAIGQIAEDLGVTVEPALKHAVVSMVCKHAPECTIIRTVIRDGMIKWRRQPRYLMPVKRMDQFS